MGGQYAGPTQDAILALAAELDVATFPTYDDGAKVLHFNGRRGTYRGDVPRISPRCVLADVAGPRSTWSCWPGGCPPAAPWSAARARRWDSETFETWLRRNAASRSARTLLALAAEAVFAAEPGDLSLLHVLFYAHAAGSFQHLIATSGGAQQDRFVGGSGLIPERLAARLSDGVVRLGQPVLRIASAARPGHYLHADSQFTSRRVIVSVPPGLAGRIDYEPALPTARDQLTQRAPMGSVIKCQVLYDEPFWRADGLSGQALGDGEGSRVVFDNSPPEGSPGMLLAFVEGDEARRLGRASAAVRREAVLGSLTRYFGPRAASPADYFELDWQQERWSGGCYGTLFGPNVWTRYGAALRSPAGLIHWAGTETATAWCGYMDGAVRSGERAATEVHTALSEPAKLA